MKALLIVPTLALLLSGCTIVSVSGDGHRPALRAYLGGVKVETDKESATVVQQVTIGVARLCTGEVTLGLTSSRCTRLPTEGCGVAVVYSPPLGALPHWTATSKAIRAHCLSKGTP